MSKDDNESVWTQHIRGILYRRRGNPERVLRGIKRMTPEEQEALYRVLQDFEQDFLHQKQVARTFRPY
jgi:hypothetical protein